MKFRKARGSIRKFLLTPKGRCFEEYCMSIYLDKWTPKDYIQAYEDILNTAIEGAIAKGVDLPKDKLRQAVVTVFLHYTL